MKFNTKSVRLACLCLSAAMPLLAQNGSVRGVVTDQSGAFVPGVKIVVTNVATGVSQTIETNERGFYLVTFLSPETYKVEASKTGFSDSTKENLKVDVDQSARADFTLFVGALGKLFKRTADEELTKLK